MQWGTGVVANGKRLVGALVVVAIVGSCSNAMRNDDESTATVSAAREIGAQAVAGGPAAAEPSTVVVLEAECHSEDTVYDGEQTCHPGGELVAVARVLDGNTLELDDSRIVRLLGVQVPDLDTCSGPGASEFTRGLVEGQQVKLHREPGVDADDDGRLLRYVQRSESPDRDGLPIYAHDLGHAIVLSGWGLPVEGRANPTYLENLRRASGIAEYQPDGIYAPPCGSPLVFGDDDGNGVADWEEGSGDYVDSPDVNLPDGALTGGYCAGKWWC